MKEYPESNHPADKERFFLFAKNVCSFNAKKWKDVKFLEKKILEALPHCDRKWLEMTLIIFENLIDFHKVNPTPKTWFIENVDKRAPKNYYFELSCKNGEFFKEQVKMEKDDF